MDGKEDQRIGIEKGDWDIGPDSVVEIPNKETSFSKVYDRRNSER